MSSTQVFGLFSKSYTLLDEIMLLIACMYVLFFSLLKKKRFKVRIYLILLSLLLISVINLSFIINFFSIKSFFMELFLYTKIITVIFILAILRKYSSEKLENCIFLFLTFIALIAIFEWLYVEFLGGSVLKYLVYLKYRDGIYRASSLTGHPISLGMLSFLMFLYAKEKKNSKVSSVIFVISMILSGSRIPIVLFISYWLWKYRNTKLFTVKLKYIIAEITLLSLAVILSTGMISKFIKYEESSIRYQGLVFSFKVLSEIDNFLIGTSIGSYGNSNSFVEIESPIYKKYKFPESYLDIVNTSSGTESFLFNSLVELGVTGTLLYYLILFLSLKQVLERKFRSFFISIVLLYSIFYPLYTLPFIYLVPYFFSKYKNKVAEP